MIILMITSVGYSQNPEPEKTLLVNGVDINKIEAQYIEIVAYTTTIYGKKWAITFDLGKEYTNWKGHKYMTEKGAVIDFESPMHAFNYVTDCGWKFVSRASAGSNGSLYMNYLMYKEKSPTLD